MQDKDILSRRQQLLEEARARTPKRWSNGLRNCQAIGEVMLNPDKEPEPETDVRNVA